MPDVADLEAAQKIPLVARACDKHWPVWKCNCSGFVRAVTKELLHCGAPQFFGSDANDIYEQIRQAPWLYLGVGSHGAVLAGQKAREGNLEIAASRGETNGHVAIVLDLDSGRGNAFFQQVKISYGQKRTLKDGTKTNITTDGLCGPDADTVGFGKVRGYLSQSWGKKDWDDVIFSYSFLSLPVATEI